MASTLLVIAVPTRNCKSWWSVEKKPIVRKRAWEDASADELVELSLNSVVGLTAPRTMKLKELIKGVEVVILIDSGVSHNFSSMEFVKKLGLGLYAIGGCGVVMGTGLTVKGEGVCRRVALTSWTSWMIFFC